MNVTPENAKMLRDYLLASYESESCRTAKMLRALPDEHLDHRPDARGMSMGETAWHTVRAEGYFVGGVVEGEFGKRSIPSALPEECPKSAIEMAEYYDRATASRLMVLRELDGAALAREMTFMGGMTLPAVTFLDVNLHHSIHHRGQLSTMLRAVGAKVPAIYGPSADEGV